MKKQMLFKTKGMNQDLSVSAFNPEFAFENMNLRLSTNEGNTMMSWVNEKGTKKLTLRIRVEQAYTDGDEDTQESGYSITHRVKGISIGTAVLNRYLVLFTHDEPNVSDHTTFKDRIYRFEYIGSINADMSGELLFKGNLHLSFDHPIETLVSYESETIQKVYWTDGDNQPRVINIVDEEKIGSYNGDSFDFVKKLKLNETVTVKKEFGISGIFAPGVIQYAFTYYTKYGQETNIFYTSPLLYISHKDRGGSPEDRIENAFKITINKVDTDFDYIRIYSIQRTSINGTPICKRVQDISTKNLDWVDPLDTNKGKKAVYTDTGTSGDSVDPTELLYKGGEVVTVGTMESKDNTLFMGNLKITRENINETLKDAIKTNVALSDSTRSIYPKEVLSGDYKYDSQLTSTDANGTTVPCGGFMYGNYYRCGVQFQHETGKWGEPIWINDFPIGNIPSTNSNYVTIPTISGTLTNANINPLDVTSKKILTLLQEAGYVKIRPVVVFPELTDRNVVCQGVIAPTMYTTKQRTTEETLYGQSSWFFRPYIEDEDDDLDDEIAIAPRSWDGYSEYADNGVENGYPPTKTIFNPENLRRVEVEGCFDSENQLKVDRKTRTLHSPDIEFDDQLSILDFSTTGYKYMGNVTFEKTMSNIDIQTESPTIHNNGMGFVCDPQLFNNENAKGIISGLFYDDWVVYASDENTIEGYVDQKASAKWLVYPWQANGSLNNDMSRSAKLGTATAILKKKIISNLRYSSSVLVKNDSRGAALFSNPIPQIFNSEENTILRFNYTEVDEYDREISKEGIYMGNIDTALVPDALDGKYFAFEGIKYDATSVLHSGWIYDTDSTPFDSKRWMKTFLGHIGSPDFPPSSSYGAVRYWDNGTYKQPPTLNTWGTDNSFFGGSAVGDIYQDLVLKKNSVRMKYKSTPHLFCKFPGIDIEPFDITNPLNEPNYTLPIVNITKTTDAATRFGGTSSDALRENTWLPCGEPVRLDSVLNNTVTFEYSYGDTYYQRWDCLKTYAYTKEDINQVVEIGSFMLQSYVNIDGRYDRNRGQKSNINMSPQNFNLMNPVYSQKDNFFSYKLLDEDYYKNVTFPNQITWSKTKESGADVDLWTNITLASVLEMDGDKGGVNKLIRFNDQLLCLQDSGLSQILYNERMQMSTVQGVPIELGNSAKVDGKRYLSDTVGCRNKWSVVSGAAGIYFMDSHEKSIYLFNGQLNNLTTKLGFNAWCKEYITNDIWKPQPFTGFVSYYDKKNQEVLFINDEKALAYSEKFGVFTSFYNYEKTPYFNNLLDIGIWSKQKQEGSGASAHWETLLWQHQAGEYCDFFGTEGARNYKPYGITLVGNPEPQADKIFTNLEFRACVDGDGTPSENLDSDENPKKVTPYLPFDSLETWNEYQHGYTELDNKSGHAQFIHGGDSSALIRKFRIWRCDIPRNNCLLDNERPTPDTLAYSKDSNLGISRYIRKPLDRMRNPWLYLKLWKSSDTNKKTEVHDVVMTYFG